MLAEHKKVQNSVQSMVAATLRMLSEEELDALTDGQARKPYTVVAEQMNFYRNWLKHYSAEDFRLEIDTEEAARELIDRAVTNFFLLTQRETPQMRRFLEYQQSN